MLILFMMYLSVYYIYIGQAIYISKRLTYKTYNLNNQLSNNS